MTREEKQQLRADYNQAVITEEDWRYNIRDFERELESADREFEPLRVQMLEAQLVELRRQLTEAQQRVDRLHGEMRKADLPPAEAPHPGGAAAAIIERDKKPRQWDQGGDIKDRDAVWEAPIEQQRGGRR
jgi:TolA-binding protein